MIGNYSKTPIQGIAGGLEYISLNGGLFVYMELLSGHEKIITKSGISLNAEILNRGFTVSTTLHGITSWNTGIFSHYCESLKSQRKINFMK
jgi:hypothetical protein